MKFIPGNNSTCRNQILRIFLGIVICIIFHNCATINTENIKYNQELDLYEYEVAKDNRILLRNDSNKLISGGNYDDFMQELAVKEFKYKHPKLIENTNVLLRNDYNIATHYSEAIKEIRSGSVEKTSGRIAILKYMYPDALYFSDCSFLEGYIAELHGDTTLASKKYSEFLNYSAGKFTERIRGSRDYDKDNKIWTAEREYAKSYLEGGTASVKHGFFEPFTPKHYYSSFHPGYNLNPEDYGDKVKHIMMFSIGQDVSGYASLGLQYYIRLNERFDINPRLVSSKGATEFTLAVPVQLYKSPNYNLGVKFSPYFTYNGIKSIAFENRDWELDESFVNFGFKASAGYYFAPKFSIGATCHIHRYNKNNPYSFNNQPLNIWYENEYDISLYYDLFKGFSLKSGIKNNDFVAGLFMSGWEIGYNFTKNDIVLRIDMY